MELLDHLGPVDANQTVGDHATACVDLAEFHRAFILIVTGDAATDATLDVAIHQATDTDCSDAKEMTSKAITQLTDADEDAYVGIEIQTEEMDLDNGFHTLKAIVTVGTGTFDYALMIFGVDPRYEPRGTTGFDELVE
ncbi:MAG: hypothetical protein GF414_00575 [Candidatus Altiarchaeales archaeon]|nr:hypothetical protein [Candidatus Altiarchaeales archaeon]